MTVIRWLCVWLIVVLAGCASPLRQLPSGADGPPLPSSGAPDPLTVPDAVPRLEPLRLGGPNKPYEVAGVRYVPMTRDDPLSESGLASWYGRKFHGRATASGEHYDMNAMTAAHPTMAIPSYARVLNPANGREVIVRVNDRGPFAPGRIIDLSYAAAVKLGVAGGVAPVRVMRLTHADILALAPSAAPGTELTSTVAAGAGAAAARSPHSTDATPSGVRTPSAVALEPLATPSTSTEPPMATPPDAMTSPPVERPAIAFTRAARGFWLQFGAFAKLEGATALRRDVAGRADWLGPLLTLFAERGVHRVQAGPYASRMEAQAALEQVRRALAMTPIIVERR